MSGSVFNYYFSRFQNQLDFDKNFLFIVILVFLHQQTQNQLFLDRVMHWHRFNRQIQWIKSTLLRSFSIINQIYTTDFFNETPANCEAYDRSGKQVCKATLTIICRQIDRFTSLYSIVRFSGEKKRIYDVVFHHLISHNTNKQNDYIL